jgi:hypothetical protein
MSKSANFHELAQWTGTPAKRAGRHGHPTLRNLRSTELQRARNAVYQVLITCLRRRDWYTLLMLSELKSMLAGLPIVRQGSTRGHTPLQRAKYVLAHLYRQRLQFPISGKRRPRREQAPFLIALHALSVECFDQWPMEATTTYKRTQAARAVYRLVKADYVTLFGKRKRLKISMQWQAVARYLYAQIEPIYRFWLRDHRAEIMAKVNRSAARAISTS